MEETIGYEALFEPEEWDSMNLVYAWDNEPDDWGSPEEGAASTAFQLWRFTMATS